MKMETSVSFFWRDKPGFKKVLQGRGGSKVQLQNYAMLSSCGGGGLHPHMPMEMSFGHLMGGGKFGALDKTIDASK